MKAIRLEKVGEHLREELKDKKFKQAYETERAKVAMAQKMAEMREGEHLKQAELARKMGVSQQFISQVETGQAKNLSLDTLIRFAATLGRSVKISFPKFSRKHPFLQVT